MALFVAKTEELWRDRTRVHGLIATGWSGRKTTRACGFESRRSLRRVGRFRIATGAVAATAESTQTKDECQNQEVLHQVVLPLLKKKAGTAPQKTRWL